MSSGHPLYLRFDNNFSNLRHIPYSSFKAIIISELSLSAEWQEAISKWLISEGCKYMMAWGVDCSDWDDAVDFADIYQYASNIVPEEKIVLTTWHEDETLEDVFWYAKNTAKHPHFDTTNTLLVHIGETDSSDYFINKFIV